jgi:hypothetical protein
MSYVTLDVGIDHGLVRVSAAAVAMRCGAKLATINIDDFKPFMSHGLLLA